MAANSDLSFIESNYWKNEVCQTVRTKASSLIWFISEDMEKFYSPSKMVMVTGINMGHLFSALAWLNRIVNDDWDTGGKEALKKLINEVQEFDPTSFLRAGEPRDKWEKFVEFLKETARIENIDFEEKEIKKSEETYFDFIESDHWKIEVCGNVRKEASRLIWPISEAMSNRTSYLKIIEPELIHNVFSLLKWLGAVIQDDWDFCGKDGLKEIIHEAQEFNVPNHMLFNNPDRWDEFVEFLKETGKKENIDFEEREVKTIEDKSIENKRYDYYEYGWRNDLLNPNYSNCFDIFTLEKKKKGLLSRILNK